MKFFNYTTDTLTELANKVKDNLSDVAGCPELNNYVVIIAERNIFGRIYDKFFKTISKEQKDGYAQVSIHILKKPSEENTE